MSDKRVVLISGGGTSGHIHPALSIGEAIAAQWPDVEVAYCGTPEGLESRLIPQAGYPYYPISAGPFPHRPGPGMGKALSLYWRGKQEAQQLVQDLKPVLVIGTGGYVCGPLLAAARSKSIPVVIHEQNAFPGRSNRFSARKGVAVCLGYGVAARYFPFASSVVETGNPVRQAILERTGREAVIQARQTLGLPTDRPVVLISGGSLGARQLNYVALEWARSPEGATFGGQVILAAGTRLYEETQALAKDLPAASPLILKPYLENMPDYLAAADLVIGRAGASTCAELAVLGKPSVLIPYPYAAGDHQTRNARVFSESGAGILIPERMWSADRMAEVLQSLQSDPIRWENMGQQAQRLGRPEAISEILRVCAKQIEQAPKSL